MADILPYREIEGQDAARLGRLSHFLNRLRWLRDELPLARPVSDWGCLIDQLLLEFYQADEEGEAQLELIRQALRQLRDQLQDGDIDLLTFTSSSTEKRSTPGMEATASRLPLPGMTKTGKTSWAASSLVSRIMARKAAFCRILRGRYSGKTMTTSIKIRGKGFKP